MDIVFKEYEYSYQNEQNETERNVTQCSLVEKEHHRSVRSEHLRETGLREFQLWHNVKLCV